MKFKKISKRRSRVKVYSRSRSRGEDAFFDSLCIGSFVKMRALFPMDTPLKKNWKKSENRGNRRRIRACRGGFSLVVSLVMMALMLTVAITLVSFVYVQGKLTESRLKRAQA
ncbi:MAG TPA: hypothetical protein IAC75_05330, partial [Candidatus Spyradosoma merdigallinarum]|nr:hypothetical protein [Candidatus Spyradosoma merdigallinarum]